MKKWDYQVDNVGEIGALQAHLDKRGVFGWELVNIAHTGEVFVLVFKKQRA